MKQDNNDSMEDIPVQSVAVSFSILNELAISRRPMRVTELAKILGETKAKIHRHLVTLKRLGLVDQDNATELYHLGWKLYQLGEAVADQFGLQEQAQPFLSRIRDETRQTTLLGIPINGEAVVVSSLDNIFSSVVISVKPGNRLLPNCSSQGRMTLAYANPAVQDLVLNRQIVKLTRYSMTDLEKIRASFSLIRERRWETSADETAIGVNTLTVPVFREGNNFAAMLSIVGMTVDIPAKPDSKQLRILHNCAAELSKLLRGTGYD